MSRSPPWATAVMSCAGSSPSITSRSPPRRTGTLAPRSIGRCPMLSGPTSRRSTCTGSAWRPARTTWGCGGSRSGMPRTTCTSSRRWPVRTAGGRGCRTTTTARWRRAGSSSRSTGLPPRPRTGAPASSGRAGVRSASTGMPPDAERQRAGRRRVAPIVSSCVVRSGSRPPAPAASETSSPGCGLTGCWCGNG